MSLELWQHWNSSYSQSLPPDGWWWDAVESVREEAEVIAVHRDGIVEGLCGVEDETYRVFISLAPELKSNADQRSGCTCPNFVPAQGCTHVIELHAYILANLPIRTSLFSKQIIHGRFSDQAFNPEPYRLDRSQMTIQTIAQMANQIPDLRWRSGFPDWGTETEGMRNAWLLEIEIDQDGERESWKISPVLQRLNKNGNAYLKGEVVAPELLLHYHNEILSDLDRQLLSFQTRPNWKSHAGIDELLPKLVAAENVLYRNKPLKVRKSAAFLTLVDEDGKTRVSVSTAHGSLDGKRAQGRSNMYVLEANALNLWVIEFPPNSIELFKKLTSLPSVALEKRNDLILELTRLQSKFPVLLPEDAHTDIQSHSGNLMMLLRSNAAGTLDFGLRVKCPNGFIALPGAMPIVTVTQTGDQKTQWVRSPEREVEESKRLLAALGVSSNSSVPFSGAVHGYDAIFSFLDKLRSLNNRVDVLWDKNSKETLQVLGAIEANQFRVKIKTKRDWFQITGDCEIGKTRVSLEELLAKLDGTQTPLLGNFVSLGDGNWARIDEALHQELLKLKAETHLEKNSILLDASSALAIESLQSVDVDIEFNRTWQQCMDRLRRSRTLNPELPMGLNADLRDYQIAGYQWMRRLSEWGIGGILADDMGLGKTLQTIAVLLHRATDGPALVLAPTSVGFNWIREIQRFAPSLNPILYRDGDRHEKLNSLSAGDIVVSSYAIGLRDKSELGEVKWHTLVCDEAQAIKNAQSKTAKAVTELSANWCVALTGTPIENHLGELWSLFRVVAPGVFGSWESFRKKYAAPIEKDSDPAATAALANRIKPFILRRTKSEVLQELPPRTESTVIVELTDPERAQYELVRRAAIGELDSMLAITSPRDKQFRIFTLLTRLRQYACHVGIVNKQWDRSSSKLELLCSRLQSLKEEGHRALVFSQFTEHLALIRSALEQHDISYEYLDGSTPAFERQKRVDSFQTGNATAFLISLKAGGTGLNLTAADYVFHMDPWWNPAVEDQATDRAHRIGQTRPVMVYRVIAKDTIEERILALHADKRDLVDSILWGTNAAASLSVDDLAELIRSSS